ncbi:MAG: hypothetical protein LQ344_008159, partial [Seirophora lacunosa]
DVTWPPYPSSDPGVNLHSPSPSNPREHGAPGCYSTSDRASEEPLESLINKRKASAFEDYDRVYKARSRPPVPEYKVKMSKTKDEIKCVTWIQADSKKAYDKERAMHFHRWGVQLDHSASCILVCEDWRLLHPSDLKETFSTENYPSTDLSRCLYRYDGYVTTLARASAWYSK